MSRPDGARRACFAGRPYIELDDDDGGGGELLEPEWPLFAFDRGLGVLERAFYRHLVRAIDLDAVFGLEQMLWAELQAHGQLSDELVLDLSNAILARALERVARDPLRSMKRGAIGPGGHLIEVPEEPHGECPFCPSGARRGRSRAEVAADPVATAADEPGPITRETLS